jgi:hypothetical protein
MRRISMQRAVMRELDSWLRWWLTAGDGLGEEVPSLCRIAPLQHARMFILFQRETTVRHAVAWLPRRCMPLEAIGAFNILSFLAC